MQRKRQSTGKLRLSVRIKLLLPFLLIILFVGLFALPAANDLIATRLEEEADDRLEQAAIAFGLLLEQTEDESLLVASFTANLPDVEAIGSAETVAEGRAIAGEVLEPLKSEFELQELSYYRGDYREGMPAYYYGGPPIDRQNVALTTANERRNELILEAIELGEATSGIVIAPQASQIIAVAPVMVDETMTGIIVAIFFIDNSYVEEISTILDVDAAIISENDVVASSIDASANIELLLQERLDLNAGEMQSINITYEDNVRRRLHSHPLIVEGITQGHVLVVRSLDDIIAVQERIQTVVLTFLAVIVAIMLLYSLGVILNVANPLKRLADAAAKVSAGQWQERVPVPQLGIEDEVVDLTRNFNAMTERLSGFYGELENKVRERTNELQDTLAELAIKRDEALQANKTKSLFLANMSHELRTPLNAIIGYSEMLEEEADDFGYEDIVPDLQKIQSAGSHLLSLINDILDISKIEAGAIELYLEDYALEDLIDQLAMTIQPVIEKNGNKLQLEYKSDLGIVHGDVTRLRQILMNLLSNAAKFTENGIIKIESKRFMNNGVDWIEIAVQDTGIGMTEEQLNKIFTEFTQADASTTRKYGGTGLGLPISRHFAAMMGGTIRVTSIAGEGSRFTVSIPARVTPPKKRRTGEIPSLTPDTSVN